MLKLHQRFAPRNHLVKLIVANALYGKHSKDLKTKCSKDFYKNFKIYIGTKGKTPKQHDSKKNLQNGTNVILFKKHPANKTSKIPTTTLPHSFKQQKKSSFQGTPTDAPSVAPPRQPAAPPPSRNVRAWACRRRRSACYQPAWERGLVSSGQAKLRYTRSFQRERLALDKN